ncbi:MAG TPA: hypothetical protein VMS60_09485 [Solirubrobacterales bacterium]|nr:hypothetical protein [Solirubrobacterales bacterium]
MRHAERSDRGRGLLLLAAALIATALVLLATAAQADDFDEIELTQSSRYLLRLTDLPSGYEFDDGECGPVELDDPSPTLAAFIRQFRPEGCLFTYERLFRAPGEGPSSAFVSTAAIAAPSVGVAEMAAATVTDLIGYLTEDTGGYTEAAPAATLGEVTRVFHVKVDADETEGGQDRLSVLFWRDGAVLAALIASGKTFAAADRVAFPLGARQQAHIDNPSRYTAAEADDSLVELDDPRIRTPVYWLGEKFAPGHGLPSARPYFGAGRFLTALGKVHPEFAVGYTKRLLLIGWTRSAWARVDRKGTNHRDWAWHCTRSRQVKLRQGHAVLYAAYGKDFARCPQRPPRHYFAHAFVGRTMVGVNQGICDDEYCVEPSFSPAFNSFRGMATVVRGLETRPQRSR